MVTVVCNIVAYPTCGFWVVACIWDLLHMHGSRVNLPCGFWVVACIWDLLYMHGSRLNLPEEFLVSVKKGHLVYHFETIKHKLGV